MQVSLLKSFEFYVEKAGSSAPVRAKDLDSLLRRYSVDPPLSKVELNELRERVRGDQVQIVECKKMARAAYIDAYITAVRNRCFVKMPEFKGTAGQRLDASERYLVQKRRELGADRAVDWCYSVHTTREHGSQLLYLVRSAGYDEYFEAADQVRSLEKRRNRKIQDYLVMVRPK